MVDRHASTARQRAFTLVELLVSSAILGLMTLALINVLNQTGQAWVAGQNQTTQRQDSRIVGDAISEELQPALLPIDNTSVSGGQFLVNPPAIDAKYQNPDAIFWQAPIARDQTLGDVAEVGYFLKWDTTTNPAHPVPQFCRFYVDPTDNADYLIDQKPTEWLSSGMLDTVAPGDKTHSYRGLFAENVIGFWVRLFDASGNIISPGQPYDSRTQTSQTVIINGAAGPHITQGLPCTVKIYIVVIGDNALQRLRAVPDYRKAGSPPELEPDLDAFISALPLTIRSSARAYTTQVQLQTAQ